MLLNTQHCTGHPPATKNYPVPNVNSAEVEVRRGQIRKKVFAQEQEEVIEKCLCDELGVLGAHFGSRQTMYQRREGEGWTPWWCSG